MKIINYLLFVSVMFFAGMVKAQKMEFWKPLGSSVFILNEGVLTLESGSLIYKGPEMDRGVVNFELNGYAKTEPNATAGIWFHSSPDKKGYEVLIHNGPLDQTRKTGSLSAVRNLYKSRTKDNEWFPFRIVVRNKNIKIQINGQDVVSYTEPDAPFRTPEYRHRILGKGDFLLTNYQGKVDFKDIKITPLPADMAIPDGLPDAVDEQTDPIIRLQQQNFPVIDYHVHLKGFSMDEAHMLSMSYGINYGIAPNCGIGFPITDDAGVRDFVESTKHLPFYFGMQGEGREWVTTFSAESRRLFDYVFTDAMTFIDHKGRRTRIWIPNELFLDIPFEKYMDVIVDRTVSILQAEPIDVYVNPTILPAEMQGEYDRLWTKERYEKVIQVLKEKNIALEINAGKQVPNFEIIKAAKDAGIKFTFGTNNATRNMGKLEYCLKAIEVCGLTVDDLWFPANKRGK